MAIIKYDKGDTIRPQATFTNSAGALTDPSSVWMFLQSPQAADPSTHDVTTYTMSSLTNASTGIWYADIDGQNHGHYKYRFEGEGIVQAAETGEFIIEEWPV